MPFRRAVRLIAHLPGFYLDQHASEPKLAPDEQLPLESADELRRYRAKRGLRHLQLVILNFCE